MNSVNRNCSTGCPTQDHSSYGECLRLKGIRKVFADSANGMDLTREKAFRRENDLYRQAVTDGLSPKGVETHHVRAAYEAAEKG